LGATAHKSLRNPGLGQLLVIPLPTTATPTTAILVLADHEQRQWSRHLLPPLEMLTQQFAWLRYYRQHLSQDQQDTENLQTLNWYKHRCLETFHQFVQENIKTWLERDAKTALLTSTAGLNQLNSRDSSGTHSTLTSDSQPLQQMRQQQLLHQLEQTLTLLTPLLKQEQWQLTANLHPVPLPGLLKRSLHHVEPLYTQRQIMLKVHKPSKVSVYGDQLKLECILFELLASSCFHAQPGSWINFWCYPISPDTQATVSTDSSTRLLELAIAESGFFDPNLNSLTSLPTQSSPSLNLKICQDIIRTWGGDLQFYQLEAERYLSRLLLPLVRAC
jgi:hypothetical protein